MAEEDPRNPLPDPRPTKIVWDHGSVAIDAQQFANGAKTIPYGRIIHIQDSRLTPQQRTQLINVMRAIAKLFGDIPLTIDIDQEEALLILRFVDTANVTGREVMKRCISLGTKVEAAMRAATAQEEKDE